MLTKAKRQNNRKENESRCKNLGKHKAPDCTVIMPRLWHDAKFLGDIGIPNN